MDDAQQIKERLFLADLKKSGLLQVINPAHDVLSGWITEDPAMNSLKQDITKLAQVDDPVLLLGPTGVGKSTLARALHGRREGEFRQINCSGLIDTLLENQLFGSNKGTYTDSKDELVGILESAHNGTVFLDEIGDMSPTCQAKVLLALENRFYYKIGGHKRMPVTCRFVFATNRDPSTSLRADLFHRISTFTLTITGLDQRPGDIEEIISGLDTDNVLSEDDIIRIIERGLPGNVRQLKSLIRRKQILGRLE